jgi:ring-1,2-phenylacetyl-CoA epoxidase subunit PaaC
MTKQEALFQYVLRAGDDSLILGQRLSEWCGIGPVLEEDIALTNIALDLIGQATSLLAYAGEVEGKGRDEDKLAFLRYEIEYKNLLLVEQPNGDFGVTIARQFLFDVYHYYFFKALLNSKDSQLAAIAEKSLKEVTYHLKHSSEWMIRLGDGTEESHARIQTALNDLWRLTGELFYMDQVDEIMLAEGIGVDLNTIKSLWHEHVSTILDRATLTKPADGVMYMGGRKGTHTEHMGYILAEMQYMQRAYPNMEW